MEVEVVRHKAAISRSSLSTPFQFLLRHGLLRADDRILDYGCGKGDDVRYLSAQGFDVRGWDPHYFPDTVREASDIVNLGFVLNVIEEEDERVKVLAEAWGYATGLLIVAVRTQADRPNDPGSPTKDGFFTRLGTFQKFFEPGELSGLLAKTLEETPVQGAPGVALVFRNEIQRQQFLAKRFRRSRRVSSQDAAETVFRTEKELFGELVGFLAERGRPPEPDEWDGGDALLERLGSMRKAISVLKRVVGEDSIEEYRRQAAEDLSLFLALEKFGGRARFSQLDMSIRRDVRALFGSYRAACETADELLFSLGNPLLIDAACRDSGVGKLTGSALYVHRSALDSLDRVLRAYEGCARAMLGDLPESNVMKFHRRYPAVSYLSYPDFDRIGHPELRWAYFVDLRGLKATYEDFSERTNPPLLHRKEALVGPEYPRRAAFERLTGREEKLGLFDHPERIGTRRGWESALDELNVEVRGHRIFKKARSS
ncbi:DNA phosphorothioation-associated putative methyltransferase [Gemmatimonadota bacterium]